MADAVATDRYRLTGALSLVEGATFVAPLFSRNDSNQQFVQEIGANGTIARFLPVRPECKVVELPDFKIDAFVEKSPGDQPLYAIRLPGLFSGFGERNQIESRLKDYLAARESTLPGVAFFRVQALKFLGDNAAAKTAARKAASLFVTKKARSSWLLSQSADSESHADLRPQNVLVAEQIESLHWLRANFDDPNWAKVWIRSYFKKRAELFKLERLAIEWMTKKLGETGDSRPIFSTLLRTRRTKLDVVSILTRKIREAQQHPERWLPYLMQLPTEAATPEIIDFCQYALSSYVEGQRPPDVSIEDVVGTWQLVSRSNLRASIFAEITWSMLTDVKLPPRRKLQFWKFLRAEPDHRDRLIVFGRQWLTRLRSENPGVFARVWVDLTDDTGSIEEIEGALYWLHELHHAAQWPEIWRRLLGQMGTQEASDLAKRWLHSLRSTSSRWSTGWLTIQATLPADEDIKQMGHHWLTSGGASRKGGRAVLERLRDLRMDL